MAAAGTGRLSRGVATGRLKGMMDDEDLFKRRCMAGHEIHPAAPSCYHPDCHTPRVQVDNVDQHGRPLVEADGVRRLLAIESAANALLDAVDPTMAGLEGAPVEVQRAAEALGLVLARR